MIQALNDDRRRRRQTVTKKEKADSVFSFQFSLAALAASYSAVRTLHTHSVGQKSTARTAPPVRKSVVPYCTSTNTSTTITTLSHSKGRQTTESTSSYYGNT